MSTAIDQVLVFYDQPAGLKGAVEESWRAVREGIIGGAAANTLTTAGSGALALTAANTYAGATIVNGGTLTLRGAGAIANSASRSR